MDALFERWRVNHARPGREVLRRPLPQQRADAFEWRSIDPQRGQALEQQCPFSVGAEQLPLKRFDGPMPGSAYGQHQLHRCRSCLDSRQPHRRPAPASRGSERGRPRCGHSYGKRDRHRARSRRADSGWIAAPRVAARPGMAQMFSALMVLPAEWKWGWLAPKRTRPRVNPTEQLHAESIARSGGPG